MRKPVLPLLLALAACGDGAASTHDAAVDAPAPPDAAPPDADPCSLATGDVDLDGDGHTPATGDCDECRADVNPSAFEVRGASPAVDDDCDGTTDEPATVCDAALPVASIDPTDAVRALDLCRDAAAPGGWGLVDASWAMPDGSALPTEPAQLSAYHLGHGLPPELSPNIPPRAGGALLLLSSGTGRRPSDIGYQPRVGYDKQLPAAYPPGMPRESAGCELVVTGPMRDPVTLELVVRAPSNAHSLELDWRVLFYDWPMQVCSQFNDAFVVELDPPPPGHDRFVVVDAAGDVPAINSAVVDVCSCDGAPPGQCTAGGLDFDCPAGDADLLGTGYDFTELTGPRGGTTWRTSRIPVEPGAEFTLRLSVWDAGDGITDTLAAIDALRFSPDALDAPTTTGPLTPAPGCGDGELDDGEACDPAGDPAGPCDAVFPGASGELRCSTGCQLIYRDCVLP
jgi:hypothetical protein